MGQRCLCELSRKRSIEPLPDPDDDIVSQRTQQHEHLLGWKALLVAFGQADALIPFKARLDASASLVVHPEHRQQHSVLSRRYGCRWGHHLPEVLVRKCANQDSHPPLSIGFGATHRDATNRTRKITGRFRDQANFSPWHMRIAVPLLHTASQALSLLRRTGFAQNVIVLLQEPIEIENTASTSIKAHQAARSLLSAQLQGGLGRLHQLLQGRVELTIACKQTINHDFLIARSEYPSQLTTSSVARRIGKVPFCGKGRFLAT